MNSNWDQSGWGFPSCRRRFLALLGAFAWLCIDLASIQEAVSGYLDDVTQEAPTAPQGGPTLVGRGRPEAVQAKVVRIRPIVLQAGPLDTLQVWTPRVVWSVRVRGRAHG